MSVADISRNAVANLGFEDVRFSVPVHAGDTLYAETTVIDKRLSRSHAGCGIVRVETRGINQRQETVIAFRRAILLKLRQGEQPGPARDPQ
jgi:acyl dehydratase